MKALVSNFGISERGLTHNSKSDFRTLEAMNSPAHGIIVDSYAINLIYWEMLLDGNYYSDKSMESID
ncbi:hypothetical protein FRB95_000011 [Tulasnella sp. JGI-2019a]|nr:hypothetical protein FRB95_000011 [Tulasnella sp. JGI-2019a]